MQRVMKQKATKTTKKKQYVVTDAETNTTKNRTTEWEKYTAEHKHKYRYSREHGISF